MSSEDTVGWDVGGAHLKVAWVNDQGQLHRVDEIATPLWRGLDCLDSAVARVSEVVPLRDCRHRLTMTGELVDLFPERAAGVAALTQRFVDLLGSENLKIYAGPLGFVDPAQAPDRHAQVASANWFATASLLATRISQGLLVDVGSTTSDLLVLQDGRLINQGYSDLERLASEELIYTGVVRTSLMAICHHAPFRGEWVSLANEHFATTADVFRVLEQLPAHADLHDSADGQGKSVAESIGRLARMIGTDRTDGTAREWRSLAKYFADRQLDRLALACQRLRSTGIGDDAPLIGAGVGRFLVGQLAARLDLPYLDIERVMNWRPMIGHAAADCAPAIAVAMLAYETEAGSCVC